MAHPKVEALVKGMVGLGIVERFEDANLELNGLKTIKWSGDKGDDADGMMWLQLNISTGSLYFVLMNTRDNTEHGIPVPYRLSNDDYEGDLEFISNIFKTLESGLVK